MGLLDRMKQAQTQASEAMSHSGGMKGMMGSMGGGNMADAAAYQQLGQKLKASGVEAEGTVLAVRDTGERDFGGGQKTEVDVQISPAGGTPYDTTVKQSFLPAQLETLAVGGAIKVKYDPDSPAMALIYGW